jgi:hypothetical protein
LKAFGLVIWKPWTEVAGSIRAQHGLMAANHQELEMVRAHFLRPRLDLCPPSWRGDNADLRKQELETPNQPQRVDRRKLEWLRVGGRKNAAAASETTGLAVGNLNVTRFLA